MICAEAEKLFESFGGILNSQPGAYAQCLMAYEFSRGPRQEIVIAGDPTDPDTRALLREVSSRFLPLSIVLVHELGKTKKDLEDLAPWVEAQVMVDGKPTAYVCENYACKLPVTDPEKLRKLLDSI